MKIQRFNESSDFKEIKTISELIAHLQEVKEKEGDINVCHSESHDYWVPLKVG
jgi:hypothetical protein